MCAIAVSGRCESTIATRSPGPTPVADEDVREPVRALAQLAEADRPGDLAAVRDEDRRRLPRLPVGDLDAEVEAGRERPAVGRSAARRTWAWSGHVASDVGPSRAIRKPMCGERRPGALRLRAAQRRCRHVGLAYEPPRRTRARRRARILPAVTGVVRVRRVDAAHPLPDVAGHVLETVRAGAARMVARPGSFGRASGRRRRSRAPPRRSRSRQRAAGLVVAPREEPAVDPACRLLPLGLGRQARPGPATEGGRVAPVDVGDGMPLERGGDGSARPVRRSRVPRGAHELPVLRVRDGGRRERARPRRRPRAAAPRRAPTAPRAAAGRSRAPRRPRARRPCRGRAAARRPPPPRAGSRRSGRPRRAAGRAGRSTGSRPRRG